MKNLWLPKDSDWVISWDVNLDTIKQYVGWAQGPDTLEKEVRYLEQYSERFGTFVFTMASQNNVLDDIKCPQCGELIAFKDGKLRCVVCNTIIDPRRDARLVLTGRLRNYVGRIEDGQFHGRPSIKKMIQKHRSLPGKWFVVVKDKVYFAPRIYALYSRDWNSSQPAILIEKSFFQEIGLGSWNTSDYHAYEQEYRGLLWLCIYRNWHPNLMGEVIHQRIVPKITIDLIISDLVAVGKLNEVLSSLGETVHTVYNVVGRTIAEKKSASRFMKLYNKYIQIDA